MAIVAIAPLAAIVAALANKQDLGLHTEMLSDEIRRLFLAGVITGKRKTLLPGKMVTFKGQLSENQLLAIIEFFKRMDEVVDEQGNRR